MTWILGDSWGAVSAVAAMVAAVAALIAIGFARATVDEARKARTEAQQAHEAETRQHQVALATEIQLQRVILLERITELLSRSADVAREEIFHPPPRLEPHSMPMSRLPSLLIRVSTTLDLLQAIGGPALEGVAELATYGRGSPPMDVLARSIDAMYEVGSMARNHEAVRTD